MVMIISMRSQDGFNGSRDREPLCPPVVDVVVVVVDDDGDGDDGDDVDDDDYGDCDDKKYPKEGL